jgi:hypothetical protein
MLNVNMGALDLGRASAGDGAASASEGISYSLLEGYNAQALLEELAAVYASMDAGKQARVQRRGKCICTSTSHLSVGRAH